MKPLQFPLTHIALFFILGIILSNSLAISLFTFAIVTFILLLLLSVSYFYYQQNTKHHFIFGIIAYFTFFTIGAFNNTLHKDFNNKTNYFNYKYDNETSLLLNLVIKEKLKSSTKNERYIAVVTKINKRNSSGKLVLNLKKSDQSKPLEIGDNIQITSKILNHKLPNNPNQFDYGAYLTNKSIYGQVFCEKSDVNISSEKTKDIWYYADKIRKNIIVDLKNKKFNDTELNVFHALLLGQQQDIDTSIIKDYQYAGAVHILSVSGLHVGFIMLFLSFLLKALPKSKFWNITQVVTIISCLWMFAILAGLSPSVVRSVTMFSFVAVALYLKRATNIYHTLIASALLILIFQPSYLVDIGFQLSYLALFFIVWLQPKFSEFWQPNNKIIKYIWDIITVSIAAQIGTFPLSIYYFHQFPSLFIITNILVIPFISIIMILGIIVIIASLFQILPDFLVKLLEYSIYYLNRIINWIASFDTFVITDISFNLKMLLISYLIIIFGFVWIYSNKNKYLFTSLICIILFQLAIFQTISTEQNKKELIVFNSKKETIITERIGERVRIYSRFRDLENEAYLLKPYFTANFIKQISFQKLENTLVFDNKKILIIDSLGVYPEKANPDIVVISQSPKLNLDRMLQTIKPKIIIADRSNFKSYILLWEETCKKNKILFHNINEKGFYKLEL